MLFPRLFKARSMVTPHHNNNRIKRSSVLHIFQRCLQPQQQQDQEEQRFTYFPTVSAGGDAVATTQSNEVSSVPMGQVATTAGGVWSICSYFSVPASRPTWGSTGYALLG
jgi:hypothetical protein